jgi:hypothetical protein
MVARGPTHACTIGRAMSHNALRAAAVSLALLAALPAAAQAQEPLSDYGQGTPEGQTRGLIQVASSRISSRTGCVARTSLVTLRGRGIRRVEWSVNGRRVATTTTRNGITRLRVNTARRGVYRVTARVVYRSGTGARPVVRRTVLQRCAQRQLPQFTG